MIKVYGIPNCNKIRNTRKLLDQHNIKHEFINVRKTPLDAHKIEEMANQLSLKELFNTTGSTYRRLQLDYASMTNTERLNWLVREQAMIRRPVIENEGHYHVGYEETVILKFARSSE